MLEKLGVRPTAFNVQEAMSKIDSDKALFHSVCSDLGQNTVGPRNPPLPQSTKAVRIETQKLF